MLVLNYIFHCLKGNLSLLHFIVWRVTCLRYVLLFECLPAFLLNSYELFCLDYFLDATSLSPSATRQTSKKSRSWTGRKSGELSCITWGTGWMHLRNETDFNFLFFRILSCGFAWFEKVQKVAVCESHCYGSNFGRHGLYFPCLVSSSKSASRDAALWFRINICGSVLSELQVLL